MILTYTPDGAEEQRWTFKLGKLRTAECEAIEKRTSMAYGLEFKQKLLEGNVTARRALLWTMLRRTHHTLRYEDIDFADDEVVLEMDRDEWQAVHDETAKAVGISDEEKDFRLTMIAAEIAKLDADNAEDEPPAESGKAQSQTSLTATG